MMRGARDGAWAKSGEQLPYGGLCFTANVADSSVALSKVGSPPDVTLVKSFDGKNWSEYLVGETIVLPNPGDRVFLAAGGSGNDTFAFTGSNNHHKFVVAGSVAASGDISSLRSFGLSHDALADYCYARLFYGCTGLTSAPELPATTIAQGCYLGMLDGCTGITSAPELPATTLAPSCYARLFYGCTGLTSAPELPATTLVQSCYSFMFYGCSSLASLKVPFIEWTNRATLSWVISVSKTGTFYKPSALPDKRGGAYIPNEWEVVNID